MSATSTRGDSFDPGVVADEIAATLPSLALAPIRLAVVAGSNPVDLSRVLGALERPPARRRVQLGEAVARSLSEVDPPMRRIEVHAALERALEDTTEVALLDRIEALFLPDLSLRVLDALRALGRTRTLVVAWPLPSRDACQLLAAERVLLYATAGHPEHVRAPVGDLPVWCVG